MSDNFCLKVVRKALKMPSFLLASLNNILVLKEISPGVSLEGMMLKLKLQYFGHLMRIGKDSLEGKL